MLWVNRYLFSVAKVPFIDYDSYDFALIVGPVFSSVNSVAGVVLSFVGDARPVQVRNQIFRTSRFCSNLASLS